MVSGNAANYICFTLPRSVHYNYYRPQRSWAKVMFLQASVILSTGGGLPQCMLGCQLPAPPPPEQRPTPTPQTRQTPPRTRQTPPGPETTLDQADSPGTRDPPRPGRHPPRPETPPGSRRQHTVNERPVRILLECILV